MLEVGMYVRCPIDEHPNNARTFYLGQITSVDEEKGFITVYFHDPKNLRAFFSELEDTMSFPMNWVTRVPALDESEACYDGSNAKILSVSKPGDKENFYYYFIEVVENGKKPSEVSLEEAAAFAKYGNAVASLCVEKRGAIPAMPSIEAIRERLK